MTKVRLFVRHEEERRDRLGHQGERPAGGADHRTPTWAEGEAVLEVQPSADVEQLDAHEIAERFAVDVRAERLKPRAEAAPTGRSRRGEKEHLSPWSVATPGGPG